MTTEIDKILKDIFGFESAASAREFLKANTKNEWGADYCKITKGGLEIYYSSNCKEGYKYQLGGHYKGSYKTYSF